MRKRILAIGSAAILVAGVTSGVAYASIPDSGGVVHSCYKTPVPAHGAPLSVIDSEAGGSCPAGSTELDFNQAGPQGPAGAQGPAGPAGPQGPPGPAPTLRVQQEQFQNPSVPPDSGTYSEEATCPPDTTLTGGGFLNNAYPTDVVTSSFADLTIPSQESWRILFYDPGGEGYPVVLVECLGTGS